MNLQVTSREGGIRLRRLSFHGGSKEPAGVDFGDRLTIITGPSNTGKSLTLETILWVLGAKTLRRVPEFVGYDIVSLALSLPNGDDVTIARSLSTRRISLHEGIHLEPDAKSRLRSLAQERSAQNRNSVSDYLMDKLGLDDLHLLETKGTRKVVRPSFRELSRFSIIPEQRMIDPRTPVHPSTNVFRETLEESLFRFLLTYVDDSGLIGLEQEAAKILGARRGTLTQVINALSESLDPTLSKDDLERQRVDIENALFDMAASVQRTVQQRDRAVAAFKESQRQADELSLRRGDCIELASRFGLLRDQYQSDLDRLEMVDEAASYLQLFDMTICPICGAAEEHQHREVVLNSTDQSWPEAIAAEIAETRLFARDLESTLNGVIADLRETEVRIAELNDLIESQRADIESLNASLSPREARWRELLEQRLTLEQNMSAIDAVEKVSGIGDDLSDDSAVSDIALPPLPSEARLEFTDLVGQYLGEWGVASKDEVAFNTDDLDIYLSGVARADQGKGVKAIIYAAFTLALSEAGYKANIQLPGFAILDSPLVTFRDADPSDMKETAGDYLSDLVAERFYRSVARRSAGQVIIVENDPPPADLGSTTHIHFTGNQSTGRYGLLSLKRTCYAISSGSSSRRFADMQKAAGPCRSRAPRA